MTIGIDCRTINRRKTGIGYYTYFLVLALLRGYPEKRFVLFFDDASAAAELAGEINNYLAGKQGNFKIVTLPFSKIKKFLPFVFSHIVTPLAFAKEKLDLLHGPANSLPIFYFGRAVVTIHDLAIYEHPEWFPGGQWFATRVLVPWSLSRASRVIAVSQATADDLVRLLAVPRDKIEVIHEGVDLEKFVPAGDRAATRAEISSRFGITKPFILFLGTLEPRKNIGRLVEAFLALPDRERYQLVIAGGLGWKFDKPADDSDLVWTGYVSDDEKIKLLQSAKVFAFPSLYEGFGLPVLEAMACGTPVVTSDNSSLVEIGSPLAVFAQAEKIVEIRDALLAALQAPRSPDDLRAQAQKFSWPAAAQKTVSVYQSIL